MDQKLSYHSVENGVQTAAAGADLLLYRKKVRKERTLSGCRASGTRLGGPQVGVVCDCACVCERERDHSVLSL